MTEPETKAPEASAAPKGLGWRVLAAYALPTLPLFFLMGPANSVIQGIYAKFFGLGLAQIALVLLIARTFNAASDPVIGYLSDRYRSGRGSRKPFLLGGSLLAVLACWFLYVPVGKVTTLSFLGWFLLADIGWSMCAVPYYAWMAELTEDYRERTRIASWRAIAGYFGYLAFFGMPLAAGRFLGTTEFTPVTLRWCAIFAAIALPGAALAAALVVPNGTVAGPPAANPFRGAMRAIAENRPLWRFMAMYLVGGLGAGMAWGVVFFYIDSYQKLGAKFSGLLVLSIPVAILATPVWGWLCNRFGKQQVWAAGYVGAGIASLGYIFILAGTLVRGLVGITLLLLNAMVVVDPVAGPAMLADVVDYGRWRFGTDQGGTYYALYGMIQKINIGIGAGAGLALAGVFGFDATVAKQSSGGLIGLFLSLSVMPAVCYLAAAVMIWRFPINRRRQKVIVKAIERRERRRAAAAVEAQVEVTP